MKSHVQVAVIGGGLIGCSILYHLTRLGMNDVLLIERDELTSGSTWHAAAGIHGLHDNNNISRLQYYTMQLYKDLEAETGQGCGIFQPGSLYLAQTVDREHQLRIQAAKARYFEVEFHELSIKEASVLHPLINFDGVRCVMFEPDGGNVDPSGVTHAYAQGARMNGAEISRFNPVLETNSMADGRWEVVCKEGTVIADIVVNAAGLWAREVAALAGIELPLMTMEHQYFVTDDISEIASLGRRLPSVADRDAEYYLRQEGQGLLVGAYEKDGRFWAEHGTPLDFGHELLPDDLDRIQDNLEQAIIRIPALGDAGIKRVINGPMIWSPDSSALCGPVPELNNYFCCNGIIPGFSQSGGLGMLMAQWIVEGEPEMDLFPWDMARYDHWATKPFTKARALDCYAHRYRIHYPYEERDAGRPLRKRPVFDTQRTEGAVFGLNAGWEHPLWYASNGIEAVETCGYERQPWFHAVARECHALRSSVGVVDISNFAKYRISGSGAWQWLDQIFANRIPTDAGRSCLTPLISHRGGIAGDFTVTCLGADNYMMFGSGLAERYHRRYFTGLETNGLCKPSSVTFESLTDSMAGFNVAGPAARELLQRLSNQDISNDALSFMRSTSMTVAGIDVLCLRVSFTGDLGFELYCDQADQLALYQALKSAGRDLDVASVGGRALLSLRVEKGYGSWGREYSPEYWPHEVGLDKLIKPEKGDFHGKSTWLALSEREPREKLVSLTVDVERADASGGEPVFTTTGIPVGRVSSGAFGHTVGESLAMAMIKPEFLQPGAEFDVAIVGKPHRARLLDQPLFDPQGLRLRA